MTYTYFVFFVTGAYLSFGGMTKDECLQQYTYGAHKSGVVFAECREENL